MYEMVELVNGILPADRPRYLMGVGTPVNILENIALGVDMFDCVMPTRNGRNGMIFTSEGVINLRNEKWKTDFSPLDPNGTSFVDSAYSRAYVRHPMALPSRPSSATSFAALMRSSRCAAPCTMGKKVWLWP